MKDKDDDDIEKSKAKIKSIFEAAAKRARRGKTGRPKKTAPIQITDSQIAGDHAVQIKQVKITTSKVLPPPVPLPPDAITEAQAAVMKQLIDRIGEIETRLAGKSSYAMVMARFKKHFKVTSYLRLPQSYYPAAMRWLKNWERGQVRKARMAGIDFDTRRDLIRRIKMFQKDQGMSDAEYRAKLQERYGVDSSTKLDIHQLNDLYSYLLGRRRRKR